MEELTKPKLKIAVLIAARGNPESLRTVIGALHMLASGYHEIWYQVACDFDDTAVQEEIFRMQHRNIPVDMSCAKQSPSLGAIWNRMIGSGADIYALVTDRAIVVSPHWDTYLADAYEKDDSRVTWWTTNAGPVIPIVPKRWLEAAGALFTDYFPFWFDDTWLHELSALVHGLPNYLIQASCFIVKRNPVTRRMRDLQFWMDFFIAKRSERVRHAALIREKLHLPEPDMHPIEEWFKSNDAMWVEHGEAWERVMGDRSEPEDTYLQARKCAQEFMDANKEREMAA